VEASEVAIFGLSLQAGLLLFVAGVGHITSRFGDRLAESWGRLEEHPVGTQRSAGREASGTRIQFYSRNSVL
jgi:hypothetical protein